MIGALSSEAARREAALAERALEEVDVALDVGRVDRIVGQRQQLEVLAERALRELLRGLR